jgi:predicted RNA-binding protein associated with RNAse of E/G family
VAKLPGLLITQFVISQRTLPGLDDDKMALRFDFLDDWYSVTAFLDQYKQPTGHYRIGTQTPVEVFDRVWRCDDLVLGLEIHPNYEYHITGEKEFLSAVDEGWMRVYSATKAREALRELCVMLDRGALPPEVMDAVHG